MVGDNPRLLLLTTADDIGGMQRVVVSLARELTRRHWRILNVFAPSPQSVALLEWCRGQRVDAMVDPALLNAGAPHRLRDLVNLRGFVRARKPDVVNLHYGDNFISLKDVLAVRLAGCHRLVISVHHPTPWGRSNRRKAWSTRVAALLGDTIVANSHATRDVLLAAGIPPHKIRLIPCGVNIPRTRPTRAAARARLGLTADMFVIGSLTRLVPHKGIADLIEAVARVPDRGGALRVVVAGEGPERAALESLSRERLGDRAIFLGRVPDTADVYAASDVFALPSYMEGFGLVYIEAAFHGVPSIGANVGGIPDAIVDGETGLLMPPGDVAALTHAIVKLRDDRALRQRLGAAAQERAYAEFTEARMAERYAHIFAS